MRRLGSATALTLILWLAATRGAVAGEAADVAPTLQEIAKLRASGDVQGAAKQAGELVAKHPDSLEAHLAYQDVQLALGKEKETIAAYRAAAAAADATADTHYLCARLLRSNSAVGEFRAALKIDP